MGKLPDSMEGLIMGELYAHYVDDPTVVRSVSVQTMPSATLLVVEEAKPVDGTIPRINWSKTISPD